MGRHNKTEVLEPVQPVRDSADGRFEGTLTPEGGDGASMPRDFLSQPETLKVFEHHLSPNSKLGLGRSAVRLAMQEAAYQLANEPLSSEQEDRRKEYLEDARDALAAMDQKQSEKMERLLADQPQSPWLNQSLGTPQKEGSAFVDRLTQQDHAGKYLVNDQLLQHFLEWHNSVLANRQHELEETIEPIREVFKQKVHKAVRKGWLPETVLEKLHRIDEVAVYADDGFTTALAKRRGYARVTAKEGEARIVLDPRVLDDPTEVLEHEYGHLLEGEDRTAEENPPENATRLRKSHGLYRLFGAGTGGRSANEAMNEHLRSSLQNGNIDLIDPDSRKRKGGYPKERNLLEALVYGGVINVDIRKFSHAFSEENVYDNRFSATQDLYNSLRKAFPFTDVVKEIRELPRDVNLNDFVAGLKERTNRYKKQHPIKALRASLNKAA